MTDQSSTDPTSEAEFAIDVYSLDGSICIDIEWVDIQTPDRIVLKLSHADVRQLISSLLEQLPADDSP